MLSRTTVFGGDISSQNEAIATGGSFVCATATAAAASSGAHYGTSAVTGTTKLTDAVFYRQHICSAANNVQRGTTTGSIELDRELAKRAQAHCGDDNDDDDRR